MPSPRSTVAPVLAAFGERVRARRIAAGLTQKELAGLAYVQPLFIYKIERRAANPSLATIALLAKALGCQVSDFFPHKAPFG